MSDEPLHHIMRWNVQKIGEDDHGRGQKRR
jgi:hypothetical protein